LAFVGFVYCYRCVAVAVFDVCPCVGCCHSIAVVAAGGVDVGTLRRCCVAWTYSAFMPSDGRVVASRCRSVVCGIAAFVCCFALLDCVV